MKSTSLRTGNWVLGNNSSVPIEVYRLDEDSINTWSSALFNPIPLTPEILEKAGFEQSGMYWVKNQVYLYFDSFTDPKFEYRFNYTKIDIPYVHSLMNLYYALTNTELEINI